MIINNNSKYNDFRNIPVWQLAHAMTLEIYVLTKSFPKEENFGITSQIRRSASSIAANIVEGMYRHTTKELIQFLYNARGSTGETLSHIILAKDLGYVKKDEYDILFQKYESIAKQLNGWINSLKKRKKNNE